MREEWRDALAAVEAKFPAANVAIAIGQPRRGFVRLEGVHVPFWVRAGSVEAVEETEASGVHVYSCGEWVRVRHTVAEVLAWIVVSDPS